MLDAHLPKQPRTRALPGPLPCRPPAGKNAESHVTPVLRKSGAAGKGGGWGSLGPIVVERVDRLQFEAVGQFDDEDRLIALGLLGGLMLKHQAGQIQSAASAQRQQIAAQEGQRKTPPASTTRKRGSG